tara:strand:- start:2483 stop:4207 length:1725 start_codon:yes stop_codon:yes gene_type:complete
MILTIISIGLQTYIPLLFGEAIDNEISEGNLVGLRQIAFIIIILGVLRAVIGYLASVFNEQISQNVEMNVRLEFFENLSRKNMNFFNNAKVGDLMSQGTQDTNNLTFAISPGIRSIVTAIFGFFAAGLAMLSLNYLLTIAFFLILPVYLFFMYLYAKNLQPISMERQERFAGINASLQENITGIRVVRTFAAQDREYKIFSEEVRDYERILVRRGEISALFIPILLISSMSAIIYIIGVNMIELNYIGQDIINILGIEFQIQPFSVGDLIAFLTLMGLLVFPTSILRFLLDVITLGFAGSSRIFNTLTTKSILIKGKNIPLKDVRGKIEFKNVSFAYDNRNNVLENISFKIESGQTLAIIGSTGSGKSTIGKLLTRMYDINSGEILLDDYNLLDLKISDVRNNISTIEQDIVLFSTTIKENIAYGVEGIDENKIMKAAKLAQAHEFISEFHDGYDTIVGEKGVTLSGGQKQRIAMARTFIKNPKILIIDDSTSAIDAKTEKMINDAMKQILKNRTTIIITHRLSNLIDADKILFLEKGIVKKIGTHEELIKNFEPYRQIFSVYQELPPIEEGEN